MGGLVALPLVVAYWPKGYVGMFDGATSASSQPWALSYADDAWRHSLLFTPRLLLLLAPLSSSAALRFATAGCWRSSARRSSSTPSIYSFYYVTALHPRFLYVTLPFVFVLEAAGAVATVGAVRRRRQRLREVRVL